MQKNKLFLLLIILINTFVLNEVVSQNNILFDNNIKNTSENPDSLLAGIMVKSPGSPKDMIYLATDDMPCFPGGNNALTKYLKDNLIYPKDVAEQGIQGKVVIGFVVKTDGHITDVEVVQSLHPVCDKEAVRLISSMPYWVPARRTLQNVYFTVPIRFVLQEKKKSDNYK